jgi:hypothetical protein
MNLADLICFHEVIKTYELQLLEQIDAQMAKKRITENEKVDLVELLRRLGPPPPVHSHVITGISQQQLQPHSNITRTQNSSNNILILILIISHRCHRTITPRATKQLVD